MFSCPFGCEEPCASCVDDVAPFASRRDAVLGIGGALVVLLVYVGVVLAACQLPGMGAW